MTTLEILIAARAEVEKGWCKGRLEDGNGNCCAVGAVRRINTGDLAYRVFAILDRCAPNGEIVGFNNAPSTTHEDMLAAFDRAINAEAAKTAPVSDSAHVHAQAA